MPGISSSYLTKPHEACLTALWLGQSLLRIDISFPSTASACCALRAARCVPRNYTLGCHSPKTSDQVKTRRRGEPVLRRSQSKIMLEGSDFIQDKQDKPSR